MSERRFDEERVASDKMPIRRVGLELIQRNADERYDVVGPERDHRVAVSVLGRVRLDRGNIGEVVVVEVHDVAAGNISRDRDGPEIAVEGERVVPRAALNRDVRGFSIAGEGLAVLVKLDFSRRVGGNIGAAVTVGTRR
jgi:hypothetical protein